MYIDFEVRRKRQRLWKNCGQLFENDQKLNGIKVVLQDQYLEEESYQIKSLKVPENPMEIEVEIDERILCFVAIVKVTR